MTILPLPMVFARIGLTVAGMIPGVPFGPDQYRSLQFDNTVEENDVSAFGVDLAELRTFADYLEDTHSTTPADPKRPTASSSSALSLFTVVALVR